MESFLPAGACISSFSLGSRVLGLLLCSVLQRYLESRSHACAEVSPMQDEPLWFHA